MTSDAMLPDGYADLLRDLKARVRNTQFRAVRAANAEVIHLYWSIGRDILDRQRSEGWGSKVIARLAGDQPEVHADGGRGMADRRLNWSTGC